MTKRMSCPEAMLVRWQQDDTLEVLDAQTVPARHRVTKKKTLIRGSPAYVISSGTEAEMSKELVELNNCGEVTDENVDDVPPVNGEQTKVGKSRGRPKGSKSSTLSRTNSGNFRNVGKEEMAQKVAEMKSIITPCNVQPTLALAIPRKEPFKPSQTSNTPTSSLTQLRNVPSSHLQSSQLISSNSLRLTSSTPKPTLSPIIESQESFLPNLSPQSTATHVTTTTTNLINTTTNCIDTPNQDEPLNLSLSLHIDTANIETNGSNAFNPFSQFSDLMHPVLTPGCSPIPTEDIPGTSSFTAQSSQPIIIPPHLIPLIDNNINNNDKINAVPTSVPTQNTPDASSIPAPDLEQTTNETIQNNSSQDFLEPNETTTPDNQNQSVHNSNRISYEEFLYLERIYFREKEMFLAQSSSSSQQSLKIVPQESSQLSKPSGSSNQSSSGPPRVNTFEIEPFLRPGDCKLELSKGCKFFIPVKMHEYYHVVAPPEAGWKSYVSGLVDKIYGENIEFYTPSKMHPYFINGMLTEINKTRGDTEKMTPVQLKTYIGNSTRSKRWYARQGVTQSKLEEEVNQQSKSAEAVKTKKTNKRKETIKTRKTKKTKTSNE